MGAVRAKYTPQEKLRFGRILRELMTEKGMTGADLAREVTLDLFLPKPTALKVLQLVNEEQPEKDQPRAS